MAAKIKTTMLPRNDSWVLKPRGMSRLPSIWCGKGLSLGWIVRLNETFSHELVKFFNHPGNSTDRSPYRSPYSIQSVCSAGKALDASPNDSSFAKQAAEGDSSLFSDPSNFDSFNGTSDTKESLNSLLSSSKSMFPLTNRRHASLFSHYIQVLARGLDVTSSERYFSTTVPALAAHCELLFYAILTFSSRHLSLIDPHDGLEAEEFHEKCLNILILFSNEVTILDENLLAATVLLRVYEELSAPLDGADEERHLSGISAYLNSLNVSTIHIDIRNTAFWPYLRQDLYSSILSSSPLKLKPKFYPLNCLYEASNDDCVWSNHAICIFANIVNFCYNGSDTKSRESWKVLEAHSERWHEHLPSGFGPVYFGHQHSAWENRFYPEIYFQQIWHGN